MLFSDVLYNAKGEIHTNYEILRHSETETRE